jgi:O-antigen/teichoic acid export membrane protein
LNLKKNVISNFILTVSNYLFPLLTYPYVCRVLGVKNIGIYSFVDSIINYGLILATLGITTLGTREIALSKKDKKLNETFTSLSVLNFVTTLVVTVALIIFSYTIPTFIIHRKMIFYGIIRIVATFFMFEWYFKGIENFGFITIRSIAVKCLYVIAVFIFVQNEKDYDIYFLLLSIMYLINGVINIYYLKDKVVFKFNSFKIKYFLKPFLYLGFYMILTSLYTTFNVIFLGWSTNSTEVGLYSVSVKLFPIILSFFTAITTVLMPRISSLLERSEFLEIDEIIKTTIELVFIICIPLTFFVYLNAEQLVYVIAGPGFEGAINSVKILSPLLIIIALEQILILQILIPRKNDKLILINSFIGAIVGISLNFLLVPKFGQIGTSIVWFVSECTILILALIIVRKKYTFELPYKSLFWQILYFLVVFFLANYNYTANFILKILINTTIFISSFLILHLVILKNGLVHVFLNKQLKSTKDLFLK